MTQAPVEYAEDVALSNVWRVRSSTVDVVELKYLLENMQDAARYLGRNPDFRVIWKGMESVQGFTDYGKKIVGLSYKFLEGQTFPTDPMLVDVLVGVLQHEMGHVRQGNIWTKEILQAATPPRGRRVRGQRRVYENVPPTVVDVVPPDLTKYEHLANLILTDACIDTAMIREHRLRGAYIWRSRRYFKRIQDENLKMLAERDEPIGWKGIAACWSAIAIYYDKIIVHRLALRPDFESMRPTLEKLMDCHLAAGQLEIEDPFDNERLKELSLQAGKILAEYDGHSLPQGQQGQEQQQQQTTPGAGSSSHEPNPFGDDDEEGAGDGKQQSKEDQEEGDEEDEGGQGETGEDEDGKGEEGTSSEEDEAPQGKEAPGAGDADDELESQIVEGMTCSTHNEGGKPMPAKLAEKVYQAIEQEVEDITQRCDLGYGDMLMRKPGVDLQRVGSVEEHRAAELQEALSVLKERARQRTVGLKNGRISEGLLWKTGTGEDTLFEREMVISDLDLRLGLVVDASSSISPMQWEIMQNTIDGFVQAFGSREDIDLVVIAYHSGAVFRVFEPGYENVRMLAVQPYGGTPTLPGLKMCLARLDEVAQMRDRTLIISVTDGQPNEGGGQEDVEEWTHEQEKRGIDVIGVGVRHSTGSQYPRSIMVSSFDEVPGELKQLVLEMDEQQ